MGQAVAVMQGEIVGRQRVRQGGLLLTLRSESGMFAVRVAEELARSAGLDLGRTVTVSGRLRSFVFKRCRSRHLYLEAQTLETGGAGIDLELVLARWLETLSGSKAQGEVIIDSRVGH